MRRRACRGVFYSDAGGRRNPIGTIDQNFHFVPVELTGTIVGIDSHEHTVTLELIDGSTREIKVAKHRDLSKVALGDSVRVTLTEAAAIRVETPKT